MLKDQAHDNNITPPPPDECAGCAGRIQDRYYLVAVERQWHSGCLRCCECKLGLDAEITCYARDGNIYCKDDYYRLFCVKRCARCCNSISANELVMRARELVYHLACFTCAACECPLSKGDVFGLRDGLVYCQPHYDSILLSEYYEDECNVMFSSDGNNSCGEVNLDRTSPSICGTNSGNKGRPRKKKLQTPTDELQIQSMRMASTALEMLHRRELSSSMESLAYDSSVTSPGSGSGHSQRTKRMRTSFKHHQLRTMKSYFSVNQNPDAKDLKQLAQKTGLSKRVLQVWFQNARAKWRRNIMRQESSSSSCINGQVGSNCSPMTTPPQLLMNDQQNIEDMRIPRPISFNELY